VDVQIDKTWRDAQARPVGDMQVGVLRGQVTVSTYRLDAHDAVGFAGGDQEAVGFVLELGALWVRKPQQASAPDL
jgi:hypothetical protein